ncbi:MAG TPA: hypothetical protein VLK30_06915 [Candidatus Limnocylindrales bacterium]|nr:hypothetical protein [Candidatus Limnocylindrales bacterium]
MAVEEVVATLGGLMNELRELALETVDAGAESRWIDIIGLLDSDYTEIELIERPSHATIVQTSVLVVK